MQVSLHIFDALNILYQQKLIKPYEMKANIYATIRCIPAILILFSSGLFANTHVESIFANQNFHITQHQDEFIIDIAKNPWESFTLAVNSNEILSNPIVNIDIRTNESIALRVDLTDGVFMSNEVGIVKKEITRTNCFTSVSFDFTNLISNIDLSGEVYLIFYVNPGECYKGQISIRNFNLTTESSKAPEIKCSSFKMFPSPATTFTTIEIPDENFQTLSLIDMNGRTVSTVDISFYKGTAYTLYLHDVPSGYYSVKISGDTNSITEKLIVN